MQSLLRYVLFFVLVLGLNTGNARQVSHWLKLGTNAPFQYSLQYEFGLSDKFFLAAESGVFAKMYQPLLFNALNRQGQRSITSAIAQSIFKSTHVNSIYAGWKAGGFQVSAFGQQGHIRGEGKPIDLIGTYYDVSPDNLPYVRMSVVTYQLGLNLGYRMPITNRFELHTSIGLSRLVEVKANITSSLDGVTSQGINQILGDQLRKSIVNYGYIPSFNVHLAYKLWEGNPNYGKVHKKLRSVTVRKRGQSRL